MKRMKRFIIIYILIMFLGINVDALSGTTAVNELPVNTEKGQYLTLKHTIDVNTAEISVDYSYDTNYLKLVGYTSSVGVNCVFENNKITCTNVNAKVAFLFPVFKITNTFNGNKDITSKFSAVTELNTTKTTISKVDKIIEVSRIELDSYEETLIVGGTYQIVATVLPENANNKTITYSSNNAEVATVTPNGLIEAIQEGTTTITATSGNQKAIFTITVNNEVIELEKIEVQEKINLKEGESETLDVIYTPEDTTIDTSKIVYSSSDEKVAVVDSNGKVIAIKEGTATITASLEDQTASTTITVTKEEVKVEKEKDSVFVPCLITAIVTFAVTMLIIFIKNLIKRKKELDGGNDSDNDDDFKMNAYI